MATDFFERQADARRNTKWLIAMFVFAVIVIVGSTFVVGEFLAGLFQAENKSSESGLWSTIPFAACGLTLLTIILGSLYKIGKLSGGGTVVAEQLGGKRIYPNTTDGVERRVLNVVEEMALASGVPVPPVFLLSDERGINAFAAGYSPRDAVVAVTRGTAEQLTRDQLQGVIAHEFSHILNGDMRLNLRLMGILFGIFAMTVIGSQALRIAGQLSTLDNRPRGRDEKGGGLLLILMIYFLITGLILTIIGSIGLFFGQLIQAAASRQREYLADASAVQFTRNPEGIAGALKRIGAAAFGSKLLAPQAAEASHMYFAKGAATLFATHPPLTERIRRIDPQWDGVYPPALPADAVVGFGRDAVGALVEATPVDEQQDLYGKPVPVEVVRHAVDQVANPTELHREYVRELIAAMPPAAVDAAREPYGARALVFATLLDKDAAVRAAQLRALASSIKPALYDLTLKLASVVNQLDVRAQLPLVDMALPALRAMSRSQYQEFAQCFTQLVQADHHVGLFEWTLHQILLRHLRPQFEKVRPPQVRYFGLQQLGSQVAILLSTLAYASQHDDDAAFQAGAKYLSEVPVELLPREACSVGQLDAALRELRQAAPKLRARLVDATAACICADMDVSVEEGELLRAICDMLNCPMPPLLAGQRVSQSLFAAGTNS